MDTMKRHRSVASRSFLSRNRSKREDGDHTGREFKEPFGLTTLYDPKYTAVVDLVIVHGLGGGLVVPGQSPMSPCCIGPKNGYPRTLALWTFEYMLLDMMPTGERRARLVFMTLLNPSSGRYKTLH